MIYERNDWMASRSSRRRRIRRDRLISVILIPAVFIIILILVISSAFGNPKEKTPKDTKTEISDSENSSTSVNNSSGLEFEIKYLNYSEIHKGSLILVNDSHEYVVPPEEESLTSIDEIKTEYYMIRDVNMQMDTLAAKNFNSMMSGFFQQSSHSDIMITEAYVSANHQNIIYNQALENSRYESRGGFSEHQTGLAADIGIYPANSQSYRYVPAGDYAWISENCTKYGFIQRYPDNKSDKTGIKDHTEHFRYVGIPHAYYMKENNLSLEEYLQTLKKYTYGSKTLSVSCYSKDYEIYFIRAKDENSENVGVYVPRNNQYTISGNNADGFIITVEK